MSDKPTPEQIDTAILKAEEGDTEAQLELGWWYLEGLGVEESSEQAVYWYTKAAEAGDSHGQYMLAKRYALGDGVDGDDEKAFYWFEQSLKNDESNSYTLFQVGLACFHGIGTDKDLERAVECFKKASEDEEQTAAIYHYGLCLLHGLGVSEDKEQGMEFIKKAAEAGEEDAQNLLEKLARKPRSYEEAMAELESMIGLKEAKHQIKRLTDRIKLREYREQHHLPSKNPNLHIVFTGNPGTGKTTVARILGDILRGIGLLESGHVIETSQADLIADHTGGTAVQVKKKCEEAMGGILFIDEAYGLVGHSTSGSGNFGADAINTLLKEMEDHRDEFVVIAAGYKDEMKEFIKANPGLASRFTNLIEFKDFNGEELEKVFMRFCALDGYHLTDDAVKKLRELIKEALSSKIDHFGNGRFMRNVFRETVMNLASRVVQLEEKTKDHLVNILAEDIPEGKDIIYLEKTKYKRRSYEEAITELENMIGLHDVKHQIKRFVDRTELRKFREQRGLPAKNVSVHLVFTGNPGTGKTTVARILGEIMREIGLLKTGHVVETSQVDLIAGYVGQTAIQVKKKVEEAMGGILFIDEAYGLIGHGTAGGGDFGADAINTLLKEMEDRRDEFVVIAAGYKDEMNEFIKANPGLASRFTNFIEFEDFSRDELGDIFSYFCVNDGYNLTDDAAKKLRELIDYVLSRKLKHFGNGRFMRNVFRETLINLASRVANIKNPTNDELVDILDKDIPNDEDIVFTEQGKKIGFI